MKKKIILLGMDVYQTLHSIAISVTTVLLNIVLIW